MKTTRTPIPVTRFAPAQRVPIQVVQRQATALAQTSLTAELVKSVHDLVFVVNQARQIVFASPKTGELMSDKDLSACLGARPGEVLGCRHAHETEGGCGTTEFCRECGVARAILASLDGKKNEQKARLTRVMNLSPEALDLIVSAVPFECQGETFSVVSITSVRRQERGRSRRPAN